MLFFPFFFSNVFSFVPNFLEGVSRQSGMIRHVTVNFREIHAQWAAIEPENVSLVFSIEIRYPL